MVEVGGVRTLFRMPDLLSIGLGGGTPGGARACRRRPAQRRLSAHRARAASSAAHISPPPTSPSPPGSSTSATAGAWPTLPRALVEAALARIHAMIEEAVDRMKTDARDVPLIAVGGGSFLVPERMPGVSG